MVKSSTIVKLKTVRVDYILAYDNSLLNIGARDVVLVYQILRT